MLEWIQGNGVRVVLVEDASRFACSLIAQELGVLVMQQRGVTVMTASGEDLTQTNDPAKIMMRQIAGAFAQYEGAGGAAARELIEQGRDATAAYAITGAMASKRTAGMANKVHLAILGQGVEAWNRWRQGNPNVFFRPDLAKAHLTGPPARSSSTARRPTQRPRAAIEAYWAARDEPRIYLVHAFVHACEQHGIEHRLTRPRRPWTNGQVERMNRTIKDASRRDASVKRYHYGSHDELGRHPQPFVDAYSYGHRLKTLRGLTPYEFICKTWTEQPARFRLDPSHLTPGPNI